MYITSPFQCITDYLLPGKFVEPRCASCDPSRDDCMKTSPIISTAAIYDPSPQNKCFSDICLFSVSTKKMCSGAGGDKCFIFKKTSLLSPMREFWPAHALQWGNFSFFPLVTPYTFTDPLACLSSKLIYSPSAPTMFPRPECTFSRRLSSLPRSASVDSPCPPSTSSRSQPSPSPSPPPPLSQAASPSSSHRISTSPPTQT